MDARLSRARAVAGLIALVVLASGCGIDLPGGGSGAEENAQQLLEESRDLQRDVREMARRAERDPSQRPALADRLDEQEQRARDLVERAREELPTDDPARGAISEANRLTAEAAREAREFAEGRDRAGLNEARDALERASDDVGDAVGELRDRVPPEARERLDELRRELP